MTTTESAPVEALKQLIISAHDHYNQAVRDGQSQNASYWAGYIRGSASAMEHSR